MSSQGRYSRIGKALTVAAVLIGVHAVQPGSVGAADTKAQADWTLLVYLNADNDLETDGLKDFAEMAKVGSTPEMNVIVQFDRTPGEFTDPVGDWTGTLRFRVEKDMKPTTASAVQDIGEADMGDGNTLADFVQWGMTNYPAKRYMLVIWGHGQGWRYRQAVTPRQFVGRKDRLLDLKKESYKRAGKAIDLEKLPIPASTVIPHAYRYVSNDYSSGSKLYNRDIQDVLKNRLQGKRLDVIGFDACLMGMIETGYAMREIASVMVASEEVEPGTGWNYQKILTKLKANISANGHTLGKLVVEAYKEQYDMNNDETTLSAVNLEQIEPLAKAVDALGSECSAKLMAELTAITTARGQCAEYYPGHGLSGIDLARFCQQLEAASTDSAIKTKAKAVRDAVKTAVLANYAGIDRQGNFGSTGIAIYFPVGKDAFDMDPDGTAYTDANTVYPLEFVQKYKWDNFLAAYFTKVP